MKINEIKANPDIHCSIVSKLNEIIQHLNHFVEADKKVEDDWNISKQLFPAKNYGTEIKVVDESDLAELKTKILEDIKNINYPEKNENDIILKVIKGYMEEIVNKRFGGQE